MVSLQSAFRSCGIETRSILLYSAHVLIDKPASTPHQVRGRLSPEHALIRHRPAPSRQVVGFRAFCEPHGFFQRLGELLLDRLALEPAAQEIRPQELAERNGLLRVSAETAQPARGGAAWTVR